MAVLAAVLAIGTPALATYTITPLSGGLSEATVLPGGSFDLDIVITSDANDPERLSHP